MNGKSIARRLWIGCFALALTLAALASKPATVIARQPVPQQSAAAQAPTGPTASATFKNIQVLKDIPADQLIPSMRYITAALGVHCDYCHEAGHFDSDDKPTKERARNMMKMMFAINTANFNGRREVTCYTCHRGSPKAASTPLLFDATAATAAISAGLAPTGEHSAKPSPTSESGEANAVSKTSSVPLPGFDEIFAKYVQAIGGADAIRKSATRIEKGTVDGPHGLHATIETDRKAPNKAFAVLHGPNGDVMEGVVGNIGWGTRPNGEVSDEAGDELARSIQWAAFYPGEGFKSDYLRFQVRGTESIDGHDAYVVMAWWPAGGADRIYFDVQSGLLVRISHRIESPLGALPLQTDYSDYREVDGLKLPFMVRVTRVDGTTTDKWLQMDGNVPVNDRRFERPAEKPEPAKPAKAESKPSS